VCVCLYCILSLTPPAIRECLCNGHKLLRQTLEIDFCLRRDLLKKRRRRQPLEWRNHPHDPKGGKDEEVNIREQGKPNTSKDSSVSSHQNALWETAKPFPTFKIE